MNLFYTVYKRQKTEVTLVFVPTSILTYAYTTDIQLTKSFILFWLQRFAIKPSTRGIVEMHMRIKETCFNANLFPVKKYKNRVITISNSKVCPPPGPSKFFIL